MSFRTIYRNDLNSRSSRDKVAMEGLPDDVVAHIFSFVDAEMLLRELRAVCRRWRCLTLNPDAWKHRSSSCCYKMQAPFLLSLRKLLTLAPCLHYLGLPGSSYPVDEVRELVLVAASTSCAVRDLDLLETCELFADVMPAVLRNQVGLGRLRRLRIVAPDDASQLWEMLEAVADLDLDYLQFGIYTNAVYPAPPGPWGKGTLKNLELTFPLSDPVFEFLVRNRASTLESVVFDNCVDELGASPVPWVAALAGCSRLKSADVPASLEVANLANCPSLTELQIRSYFDETVSVDDVGQIKAAIAYSFVNATHLRQLEFDNFSCDHFWLKGTDVVSALAQSCTSKLSELSLAPKLEKSDLEKLLQALPGLPHLQTLELNSSPSREFLEGLATSSAPRLSVLRIKPRDECVSLCLVRTVSKVVLQGPKLHVIFDGQNCDCDFYSPASRFGLYGHHPSKKCSWHISGVDWQWASR